MEFVQQSGLHIFAAAAVPAHYIMWLDFNEYDWWKDRKG